MQASAARRCHGEGDRRSQIVSKQIEPDGLIARLMASRFELQLTNYQSYF